MCADGTVRDDLEALIWAVPGPPEVPVFRGLERVLAGRALPALRDPVVREHAVAYALEKHPDPVAGVPGPSITVTVLAPRDVQSMAAEAVGRHLEDATPMTPGRDAELLLAPVAEEYRQGLREATDIALDLHAVSPSTLRAHQRRLIEIGCAGLDPRFALQEFLPAHSPSYRAHGRVGDPAAGPLTLEALWMRLYTPGPTLNHPAPIWLLWNVVVGRTPKRWKDPETVAESIGIRFEPGEASI